MKRNPVAKALRTPKFKKRIIKDKKKYNFQIYLITSCNLQDEVLPIYYLLYIKFHELLR